MADEASLDDRANAHSDGEDVKDVERDISSLSRSDVLPPLPAAPVVPLDEAEDVWSLFRPLGAVDGHDMHVGLLPGLSTLPPSEVCDLAPAPSVPREADVPDEEPIERDEDCGEDEEEEEEIPAPVPEAAERPVHGGKRPMVGQKRPRSWGPEGRSRARKRPNSVAPSAMQLRRRRRARTVNA